MERVADMGQTINGYRISVGKPERKKQTERQKCKYDNIKIVMVWKGTAFK